MIYLTPAQQKQRQDLIETLAKQFAKASGYAMTEDNVNQWLLVSSTLVNGILELIPDEPGDPGTEIITSRHTDITD